METVMWYLENFPFAMSGDFPIQLTEPNSANEFSTLRKFRQWGYMFWKRPEQMRKEKEIQEDFWPLWFINFSLVCYSCRPTFHLESRLVTWETQKQQPSVQLELIQMNLLIFQASESLLKEWEVNPDTKKVSPLPPNISQGLQHWLPNSETVTSKIHPVFTVYGGFINAVLNVNTDIEMWDFSSSVLFILLRSISQKTRLGLIF